MFESAKELMQSRQDIIDHDSQILNHLEDQELSVHDIWLQLSKLQSDTIRFYACEDFLTKCLGEGKVENASDERVSFMKKDLVLSFPCEGSKNQFITVGFKNYEHISEWLSRPDPIPASDIEVATKAYVDALKNKADVTELLRLRTALNYDEVQSSSTIKSFLYYYFILKPLDFWAGRSNLSYWEHSLSEMQAVRINRYNESLNRWVHCKEVLQTFQVSMYEKLRPFEFPVCLVGVNKEWEAIEVSFNKLL